MKSRNQPRRPPRVLASPTRKVRYEREVYPLPQNSGAADFDAPIQYSTYRQPSQQRSRAPSPQLQVDAEALKTRVMAVSREFSRRAATRQFPAATVEAQQLYTQLQDHIFKEENLQNEQDYGTELKIKLRQLQTDLNVLLHADAVFDPLFDPEAQNQHLLEQKQFDDDAPVHLLNQQAVQQVKNVEYLEQQDLQSQNAGIPLLQASQFPNLQTNLQNRPKISNLSDMEIYSTAFDSALQLLQQSGGSVELINTFSNVKEFFCSRIARQPTDVRAQLDALKSLDKRNADVISRNEVLEKENQDLTARVNYLENRIEKQTEAFEKLFSDLKREVIQKESYILRYENLKIKNQELLLQQDHDSHDLEEIQIRYKRLGGVLSKQKEATSNALKTCVEVENKMEHEIKMKNQAENKVFSLISDNKYLQKRIDTMEDKLIILNEELQQSTRRLEAENLQLKSNDINRFIQVQTRNIGENIGMAVNALLKLSNQTRETLEQIGLSGPEVLSLAYFMSTIDNQKIQKQFAMAAQNADNVTFPDKGVQVDLRNESFDPNSAAARERLQQNQVQKLQQQVMILKKQQQKQAASLQNNDSDEIAFPSEENQRSSKLGEIFNGYETKSLQKFSQMGSPQAKYQKNLFSIDEQNISEESDDSEIKKTKPRAQSQAKASDTNKLNDKQLKQLLEILNSKQFKRLSLDQQQKIRDQIKSGATAPSIQTLLLQQYQQNPQKASQLGKSEDQSKIDPQIDYEKFLAQVAKERQQLEEENMFKNAVESGAFGNEGNSQVQKRKDSKSKRQKSSQSEMQQETQNQQAKELSPQQQEIKYEYPVESTGKQPQNNSNNVVHIQKHQQQASNVGHEIDSQNQNLKIKINLQTPEQDNGLTANQQENNVVDGDHAKFNEGRQKNVLFQNPNGGQHTDLQSTQYQSEQQYQLVDAESVSQNSSATRNQIVGSQGDETEKQIQVGNAISSVNPGNQQIPALLASQQQTDRSPRSPGASRVCSQSTAFFGEKKQFAAQFGGQNDRFLDIVVDSVQVSDASPAVLRLAANIAESYLAGKDGVAEQLLARAEKETEKQLAHSLAIRGQGARIDGLKFAANAAKTKASAENRNVIEVDKQKFKVTTLLEQQLDTALKALGIAQSDDKVPIYTARCENIGYLTRQGQFVANDAAAKKAAESNKQAANFDETEQNLLLQVSEPEKSDNVQLNSNTGSKGNIISRKSVHLDQLGVNLTAVSAKYKQQPSNDKSDEEEIMYKLDNACQILRQALLDSDITDFDKVQEQTVASVRQEDQSLTLRNPEVTEQKENILKDQKNQQPIQPNESQQNRVKTILGDLQVAKPQQQTATINQLEKTLVQTQNNKFQEMQQELQKQEEMIGKMVSDVINDKARSDSPDIFMSILNTDISTHGGIYNNTRRLSFQLNKKVNWTFDQFLKKMQVVSDNDQNYVSPSKIISHPPLTSQRLFIRSFWMSEFIDERQFTCPEPKQALNLVFGFQKGQLSRPIVVNELFQSMETDEILIKNLEQLRLYKLEQLQLEKCSQPDNNGTTQFIIRTALSQVNQPAKFLRLNTLSLKNQKEIPQIFQNLKKLFPKMQLNFHIERFFNTDYLSIPLKSCQVKSFSWLLKTINVILDFRIKTSVAMIIEEDPVVPTGFDAETLRELQENQIGKTFARISGTLNVATYANFGDLLIQFAITRYGVDNLVVQLVFDFIATVVRFQFENQLTFLVARFLFQDFCQDYFLSFVELLQKSKIQLHSQIPANIPINEMNQMLSALYINQQKIPYLVDGFFANWDYRRKYALSQLLESELDVCFQEEKEIPFFRFLPKILSAYSLFRRITYQNAAFIFQFFAEEEKTPGLISIKSFRKLCEIAQLGLTSKQVEEFFFASTQQLSETFVPIDVAIQNIKMNIGDFDQFFVYSQQGHLMQFSQAAMNGYINTRVERHTDLLKSVFEKVSDSWSIVRKFGGVTDDDKKREQRIEKLIQLTRIDLDCLDFKMSMISLQQIMNLIIVHLSSRNKEIEILLLDTMIMKIKEVVGY